MLLLALFILGTQVGSFLNVCIWRLPRGESIVQPPSHCPRCDTRLRALDLVPLLSQVFLRARCRYCGAAISWRYFGIELMVGLLFVLVGAQPGYFALTNGNWWTASWSGDVVRLARDMIFVSTLIVIFWIDYETRLIQLEAVLLLGFAGITLDLWQVWQHAKPMTEASLLGSRALLPAPLPESLLALVVTATGLWILREVFSWIYGKEALGFGDVMLVAAIAANLGWNATIFTFFFLAIVVGAFIGVALQIPRAVRAYTWALQRQKRYEQASPAPWPLFRHAFRKAIPFGPMLAAGAIVALLYGQHLNKSYIGLMNPPPATQQPISSVPLPPP